MMKLFILLFHITILSALCQSQHHHNNKAPYFRNGLRGVTQPLMDYDEIHNPSRNNIRHRDAAASNDFSKLVFINKKCVCSCDECSKPTRKDCCIFFCIKCAIDKSSSETEEYTASSQSAELQNTFVVPYPVPVFIFPDSDSVENATEVKTTINDKNTKKQTPESTKKVTTKRDVTTQKVTTKRDVTTKKVTTKRDKTTQKQIPESVKTTIKILPESDKSTEKRKEPQKSTEKTSKKRKKILRSTSPFFIRLAGDKASGEFGGESYSYYHSDSYEKQRIKDSRCEGNADCYYRDWPNLKQPMKLADEYSPLVRLRATKANPKKKHLGLKYARHQIDKFGEKIKQDLKNDKLSQIENNMVLKLHSIYSVFILLNLIFPSTTYNFIIY